jgi:hypothetical protein
MRLTLAVVLTIIVLGGCAGVSPNTGYQSMYQRCVEAPGTDPADCATADELAWEVLREAIRQQAEEQRREKSI